jgi:hypothetical protein
MTMAPLMVTLGVAKVVKVPAGVTIPLDTAGVTDPTPNATKAICAPDVAVTIAVLA